MTAVNGVQQLARSVGLAGAQQVLELAQLRLQVVNAVPLGLGLAQSPVVGRGPFL
jgi:hypothetical protein